MEAVAILRQLWRGRLLVAVGLAIALLIGIVMAYRVSLALPPKFESRQYKVGVASAGVLIDSQSSQVVDLGGGQTRTDVASLSTRARLLANLMASSPLKDRIARRAGVPADTLLAAAPAAGFGPPPQPTATGAQVSASDPDAYILTLKVSEEVPIITIDAQAPTAPTAARISSAAVAELRGYLRAVALNDSVPGSRQLVIDPLGDAKSATVTRGQRRLLPIGAALFVFSLWCAGILLMSGLARALRQTPTGDDPSQLAMAVADLPERHAAPAPNSPASAGRVVAVPLEQPERPQRLYDQSAGSVPPPLDPASERPRASA